MQLCNSYCFACCFVACRKESLIFFMVQNLICSNFGTKSISSLKRTSTIWPIINSGFQLSFTRETTFDGFLFAYLYIKSPLKRDLLLKERMFSQAGTHYFLLE